jgi:hypothetical protein
MEKPFRVNGKAVWGSGIVLAALLALAALAAGCGKTTEGQGPAFLVVEKLEGAPGVDPGAFSTYLMSDVLTYVKVDGVRVPNIFEDPARATVHVEMKDMGRPGSPNTPSSMNQVVLERFHVNYIRADGRNNPGVDVPYGYDGTVTSTVTGAAAEIIFPIVRAAAKTESPLVTLVGGGGAQHISCIAQVTLYGHDYAGNAISASGQITIEFADWGDPSS